MTEKDLKEEKNFSSSNDEIDIIELIKKIIRNRKFIIKVIGLFLLLGIFIAIFSYIEYTSTSIMVPQTEEQRGNNNLGGLASMAGINLGGEMNSEILSMEIYPQILASVPFQKELMQQFLNFEGYENPIKLLDYFTDKKYQKFNIISFMKKYTIGLPGVIMGSFRKDDKLISSSDNKNIYSSVLIISKEEKKCIDILKNRINLIVNDKKGYVELETRMPEALAAAQLAEHVQVLLQKYITTFKIAKVQSNLEFIEERWKEAKNEFEGIQQKRAAFIDANKDISRARASTEREKWDTDYSLAFNVYSELAKQLEQAKIKVKETTPILTVIDPPTVPIIRSKPRRILICIGFAFLGGILGIGLVLVVPFYNRNFQKQIFKNSIQK